MLTHSIAAATALTLSAATGVAADGTAGATATIQSTIDAMTSAFAAGDIDGVLAAYEPGAVVVEAPGESVAGTEALRAMFARFVALDPRFTFIDHEIVEAGDIALHLSTWTMEGRLPDGTPVAQGGLSVAVLRRQADGRWLMVIDDPYGDHIIRQ
jgi:uncharacterized protein (TIGR02246 family)